MLSSIVDELGDRSFSFDEAEFVDEVRVESELCVRLCLDDLKGALMELEGPGTPEMERREEEPEEEERGGIAST